MKKSTVYHLRHSRPCLQDNSSCPISFCLINLSFKFSNPLRLRDLSSALMKINESNQTKITSLVRCYQANRTPRNSPKHVTRNYSKGEIKICNCWYILLAHSSETTIFCGIITLQHPPEQKNYSDPCLCRNLLSFQMPS